MVDKDGFRSNVAIVIGDGKGHLFWAKRLGQNAWQFPQGGIDPGESAEDALYRELYEEVGLESDDVKIVQRSKNGCATIYHCKCSANTLSPCVLAKSSAGFSWR